MLIFSINFCRIPFSETITFLCEMQVQIALWCWTAWVNSILFFFLQITLTWEACYYYCYRYNWNTILKKKMLNVYFWNKNEKNVPDSFEQWFKKRTWLEERVSVCTISAGNARILNMPKSAEICPNVGKYSSICVTLWLCLNMCETLRA